MSIIFIKTISFSRLRNAHHVGFHAKFQSELDKYDVEKLGIDTELYARYCSAINAVQDIVNRSRASEHTISMNQFDEQRDKLFRKLIYMLKAAVSSEPTETLTQERLNALQTNILDLYPISIADGGIQEETAKLRGLIKDLQVYFSDITTELGVEPVMTALETANDNFEKAFMDRIREKAANTNTLEARSGCDDAYLQITFYLNSMANVSSTVAETKLKAKLATSVVNETNELITYYQGHYYSKPGTPVEDVIDNENEDAEPAPEVEANV